MTIGALVVTHGQLGETLVGEVEYLVGRQHRIRALSTLAMSAEAITERVREVVGTEPWIVFTDTPGTSPTIRSLAAISDGQAVVTGVNIGMLLSFLMHRGTADVHQLAERMVRDGRRAVEVKWARNREQGT